MSVVESSYVASRASTHVRLARAPPGAARCIASRRRRREPRERQLARCLGVRPRADRAQFPSRPRAVPGGDVADRRAGRRALGRGRRARRDPGCGRHAARRRRARLRLPAQEEGLPHQRRLHRWKPPPLHRPSRGVAPGALRVVREGILRGGRGRWRRRVAVRDRRRPHDPPARPGGAWTARLDAATRAGTGGRNLRLLRRDRAGACVFDDTAGRSRHAAMARRRNPR